MSLRSWPRSLRTLMNPLSSTGRPRHFSAGRIIEPNGDVREVCGGIGGPGGIDIIGPVVSNTTQPDINAIAADEAGNMYALQIVQIPLPGGGGGQQQTKNLVFVVQITFPT